MMRQKKKWRGADRGEIKEKKNRAERSYSISKDRQGMRRGRDGDGEKMQHSENKAILYFGGSLLHQAVEKQWNNLPQTHQNNPNNTKKNYQLTAQSTSQAMQMVFVGAIRNSPSKSCSHRIFTAIIEPLRG